MEEARKALNQQLQLLIERSQNCKDDSALYNLSLAMCYVAEELRALSCLP